MKRTSWLFFVSLGVFLATSAHAVHTGKSNDDDQPAVDADSPVPSIRRGDLKRPQEKARRHSDGPAGNITTTVPSEDVKPLGEKEDATGTAKSDAVEADPLGIASLRSANEQLGIEMGKPAEGNKVGDESTPPIGRMMTSGGGNVGYLHVSPAGDVTAAKTANPDAFGGPPLDVTATYKGDPLPLNPAMKQNLLQLAAAGQTPPGLDVKLNGQSVCCDPAAKGGGGC